MSGTIAEGFSQGGRGRRADAVRHLHDRVAGGQLTHEFRRPRRGPDDAIGRGASIALIIVLGSMLGATPAHAGPCAKEIAALRESLRQTESGGKTIGSAPQSIGAQLEHQPTPASVARAKENARARIAALLAQAETLDAQGKLAECQEALRTASLLLNP